MKRIGSLSIGNATLNRGGPLIWLMLIKLHARHLHKSPSLKPHKTMQPRGRIVKILLKEPKQKSRNQLLEEETRG